MTLAGCRRTAFLSDIHGNAHAFSAALAAVRALDVEALVIMGDILTYGCEPCRTLELLASAMEEWDTALIAGNHDQLYFAVPHCDASYEERLPDWIRESVLWTRAQPGIGEKKLEGWPWVEAIRCGECMVAHANPFGYGDWTYLTTEHQRETAARELRAKGVRIGIFGHSHRPLIASFPHEQGGGSYKIVTNIRRSEGGAPETWVANPGSIGQPRGGSGRPTLLLLDNLTRQGTALSLLEFDYDIAGHLDSIAKSSLSQETKDKLLSFHAKGSS